MMNDDGQKNRIDPVTLGHARSLREKMTSAESKLWRRLRSGQLLGYKFRRQHPVGKYITDFCCTRCKLVIEIDGDTHFGQDERDLLRTAFLKEQGYEVIRFCNSDVHTNLEGVLEVIYKACLKSNTSD